MSSSLSSVVFFDSNGDGAIRMAVKGSIPFAFTIDRRLSDGALASLPLKAWRPDGAACLKWEMSRLLYAVGYEARSRNTECHAVINQHWNAWGAWLHLSGLTVGDHMGRSAHSVRQLRGSTLEDLVDASLVFWLSTVGAMCLLSHLVKFRRAIDMQARTAIVFDGFLERGACKTMRCLFCPGASLMTKTQRLAMRRHWLMDSACACRMPC